MNGKPVVMVLGVFHFRYMEDVLEPHRQREVVDLVNRIKRFCPTKVGVEVVVDRQNEINGEYQRFLNGEFELTGNEVHQLAFRIARDLGHQQVHATDWMHIDDSDKEFLELGMQEAESKQPELIQELEQRIERLKGAVRPGTVTEMILSHNNDELNTLDHQTYIRYTARLGNFPDYVGTFWMRWWYRRNLIIYSNVCRLATEHDDRILIIYGSGHNYLLRQFIRESGLFQLERVESYLQ